MEDPNKALDAEKERLFKIGEELDAMQASKNEGRGVSAVRTVVFYLKQGDWESAKTVAEHDNDKIRYHPEIRQWMLGKDILKPGWSDRKK